LTIVIVILGLSFMIYGYNDNFLMA